MDNSIQSDSYYADKKFINLSFPEQEIFSVEFDRCVFDECNFTDSQFINCKFSECKFINCNLSLIKVKGSSFLDVVFRESKMIGINWTEAAWPKIKLSSPIEFYQCKLDNSSFFALSIEEIILRECSAKEVDFREADCSAADFSLTDFVGSHFGKTNLSTANFSDAINYQIDLFLNQIKGATFTLPEATRLLDSLDIQLIE